MTDNPVKLHIAELTAKIVSAYVSKNTVESNTLPDLINTVAVTLGKTSNISANTSNEDLVPAVPIKKSITPDFIICLEDGKKFKSLKRHLKAHYKMTPDEYREKWKLPFDYPMVAPNYAKKRSSLAKEIGLGRRKKK